MGAVVTARINSASRWSVRGSVVAWHYPARDKQASELAWSLSRPGIDGEEASQHPAAALHVQPVQQPSSCSCDTGCTAPGSSAAAQSASELSASQPGAQQQPESPRSSAAAAAVQSSAGKLEVPVQTCGLQAPGPCVQHMPPGRQRHVHAWWPVSSFDKLLLLSVCVSLLGMLVAAGQWT